MGVSDRWVRNLLRRMKQARRCGGGAWVAGPGIEPQDRDADAEAGHRASEAARVARLRTNLCQRAVSQTASDRVEQRDPARVDDRSRIVEDPARAGSRRSIAGGPAGARFGELVQWDTSEHDWLEGRGPVRYLVRLIDDATSWSWGRFVEHDATPFNMAVLWEYLEKNGRMVDVYTDRDSMFTVAPRAGESEAERSAADRLTQMGRGLRELGIGWIAAYSPQAKGRIERSFLTAQDRLVKDLRLAKVSTMEAANAFLEKEYWPEWNERFARPVADFPNQHRALTPALELAAILCHVESRVIGNDYTFSFAGRRYQIAREQAQAGMRHQRLRVELRLNGELHARYQQRYLNIAECGARSRLSEPALRKPVRKDHNAGGKSSWMQGFFDRPSPPLWKADRRDETHFVRRAGVRRSSRWICPKPPLGSFTSTGRKALLTPEETPREF